MCSESDDICAQAPFRRLQPGRCEPFEAFMEDHIEDVRRGCERAYPDAPNQDNLTIITVEERHLGHC